ncbi:response regulator transcription factor [Robertmurraya korlensis]|uniref:response regulator n=1 Tax=Robertmurraya korlensis TaxID=519977 RepID=UPI00203C7CBA|nr:response regulator transcription factor [Robertmurraya korlensis]MCM3603024.1 response regulator transcription factor [Robertmurraya korlensis]
MKTIRVLLADDHPFFLYGVSTYLKTVSEIEIVGEANSGEDVVNQAKQLNPDVILMDIRMPGMNGIEATKKIKQSNPETNILIFTMFKDDQSVFTAMRMGAKGYILKDAGKEDIIRAIKTIAAGEAIFSAEIAAKMVHYFSSTRPAASEQLFPELTSREREVLYLIADGATNKEIAEHLNISNKTVSNYVTNILNKLQVSSREEAIQIVNISNMDQQ